MQAASNLIISQFHLSYAFSFYQFKMKNKKREKEAKKFDSLLRLDLNHTFLFAVALKESTSSKM